MQKGSLDGSVHPCCNCEPTDTNGVDRWCYGSGLTSSGPALEVNPEP